MSIVKDSSPLKFTALVVVFVVVAILFSGCSGDSPLGTDDAKPQQDLLKAAAFADSVLQSYAADGLAADVDLDYLRNDPYYLCDVEVTQEVNENGGVISLELDNEEIYFWVPAGALKKQVEIELWGFKFRTPFGDVWIYDCGPDGLKFNVPMWVNHPIDRQDGQAAALIYIDESKRGNTLELEAVSPVQDGHVKFRIYHFSKYAIT